MGNPLIISSFQIWRILVNNVVKFSSYSVLFNNRILLNLQDVQITIKKTEKKSVF